MDKSVVPMDSSKSPSLRFPRAIIFVATQAEYDKIVRPVFDALKAKAIPVDDVWAVVTGVGKVCATKAACMALNSAKLLNPRALKSVLCINVGLCAGNSAAMAVPDTQIHSVVNYDHNLAAFYPQAEMQQYALASVESGNVCLTQDHFCMSEDELPDATRAYYVDMELFALASVCHEYGVRLSAMKSVSGYIKSGESTNPYDENVIDEACQRASNMLLDYFESGVDITL